MLVRIYRTLNECINFETDLTDTREIFNSIKYTYGEDIIDSLLYAKHVFVGTIGERVDALTPSTLFSDLTLYEELYIIPKVEGAEPITATMVMSASISATSAVGVTGGTILMSAGVASAIAAVANLAIGIGISMCVSALMSPTNTFGSDAARSQKSSTMFNSAVTITEQGGSVPLTYGNPFCGGVLISSGLTSTDK
jgi:predicted phage tail protein